MSTFGLHPFRANLSNLVASKRLNPSSSTSTCWSSDMSRTPSMRSARNMTTSANDIQKPPNMELRKTAEQQPSVEYSGEEDTYESIESPTYLNLTRSSRTSSTSTSRPTSANNATGSTDSHNSSVYINVNKTHLETSPAELDRRPAVMNRQSEKPSSKDKNKFQDDEDGYCMPYPHTSPLKDVERGQGVGAEEDRNPYYGPPASTIHTTGNPLGSAASSAPVPHRGSLQRVGFTSLDDIPTDLSCLSVVEVLQCLRWLNLHRYVDMFRAERIDGVLLMSLDQQVLVEELGFKRLEAIKLEKFARHGWRPKLDSDSSNQHHLYYQQQQQQLQLQFHSQNEPLFTDV